MTHPNVVISVRLKTDRQTGTNHSRNEKCFMTTQSYNLNFKKRQIFMNKERKDTGKFLNQR